GAEGHDERDDDGGGEDGGELAEQPADDAAHEQDGEEYRHQRDADREHREADLAGSLQRGGARLHARLHVPHDVLEHHDGIVHHEAGGDGEGRERQVVQAVAAQPHDSERADERHGHGHRRYERGARTAQEGEDDERHQDHGDDQRHLDVV